MAITRIHLLPAITAIIFPGSIITTYIVSVLLGHVNPDFPYISDTGNQIPESCIFSQMINITAALIVGCMYVRYKHVEQHHRDHMRANTNRIFRLNQVAFVLGVWAALGLSIVSNFQESDLFPVHMAGFVLATVGGLSYIWLQTGLSFHGVPLLNSRPLAWVRCCLASLATMALIATIATGMLSHHHPEDAHKVFLLKPSHPDYPLHIASAVMEWILMLALNFFLLTFSIDFKKITLESPKVVFLLEEIHLSTNSEVYQSSDRISEQGQPRQSAQDSLFRIIH